MFSSIYTLNQTDLLTIGIVTVVVLIVIFAQMKELFLITFDEEAASVSGLPLKTYNVMISVLTALVISVAIKIVGALLVSALLTIPAACSLILARSFRQSVAVVVSIGVFAVLGGLLIAGLWNLAPGGTIVLLMIALLLVLLLLRRFRAIG